MEYTSEQADFLSHPPTRNACILAGPGTGKSFTAVAYLSQIAVADPDLACRMITFTRNASREFSEKIMAAGLGADLDLEASTIHSFALGLLIRMGFRGIPTPLRIPDDWETKRLIHPYLSRRLRVLGHQVATPTVVDELEKEMAAGWEALDPDAFLNSRERPQLANAYSGAWMQHRNRLGYTLLAELPFRAGLAVEDSDEVHGLDTDLLVVDEYQDLNLADIKLVQLVAASGATVIAIGDADQSIYSWRMAAPQGIREFPEDFSADIYPLTMGMRCGDDLARAATSLIETAPDREAQTALTSRLGAPQGTFAYLRFPTQQQEAASVARLCLSRNENGVEPSDIALLVRSGVGAWRSVLQPLFDDVGIPLVDTGWIDEVLGEHAVRRAMALSRLSANRHDSLAWLGILHLASGVGGAFVDYVYEACLEDERFGACLLRLHDAGMPGGPRSSTTASIEINDTLGLLSELDVDGVELDEHGWGGWLVSSIGDDLSEQASELALRVGSVCEIEDGLSGFLNQLGPIGKELAAADASGVRLMTIAGSKGITVNTAILLGVEDGLIPMPPPKGRIDEERRILYVGMTRATDVCILTSSARRTGQLARRGRPNTDVRSRSPLLADLRIGRWIDGVEFVEAFVGS